MSIVLEICIYLMVILSLMLVTIAFFKNTNEYTNSSIKKESYIRKKNGDTKVDLKLYTYNISEEEKEQIKGIISEGEFNNIFDIIDDFKVISKRKTK